MGIQRFKKYFSKTKIILVLGMILLGGGGFFIGCGDDGSLQNPFAMKGTRVDGADGATSLITISDESSGTNCTSGGKKVV